MIFGSNWTRSSKFAVLFPVSRNWARSEQGACPAALALRAGGETLNCGNRICPAAPFRDPTCCKPSWPRAGRCWRTAPPAPICSPWASPPAKPPELVERRAIPTGSAALHQAFVEAGADIVLTNSFGGNRRRLALHGLEASVARTQPACGGERPRGRGQGGPAGRRRRLGRPDRRPLRAARPARARRKRSRSSSSRSRACAKAARTSSGSRPCRLPRKSAPRPRAAAIVGMPSTVTASFDTAGRTMMGVAPAALGALVAEPSIRGRSPMARIAASAPPTSWSRSSP